MATLAETETYEAGIYQLEITDPVIGGPDGIDNLQAKQLANRTNWLKAKIDSILGMSFIHTAVAENPGDTDEFGYWDSLTLSLRKVTLANFKATLLTYFDTFYSRTAALFGVGQTWQNVSGSRVAGTNYTNTTGKPIEVSFWGTSPSGVILSINAYVGGVNVAYIYNQATAGGSTVGAVTFIVPNGVAYSIAHNSTATQAWSELR